jgi:hypothetical protein
MSYLPAIGERIFLVETYGDYRHLRKLPLKVIAMRENNITVECLEHPAFANGVRHKKNSLVGFQFTVSVKSDIVPADLRDAAVFYTGESINPLYQKNGWLNSTAAAKARILEQYRQDKGMEPGKEYIVKVIGKTGECRIKVLKRSGAKYHKNAVYTVQYDGKTGTVDGCTFRSWREVE